MSNLVLRVAAICLDAVALPAPSMFGRDLVEQVQADSRDDHRMIPVLVEKCIDAVDNIGESGRSGRCSRIANGVSRSA